MLVVDSSVWIDYFRGTITAETECLHAILGRREVLVGDVILYEVLQGCRSQSEFATVLSALNRFSQVAIVSRQLAIQSALNYRSLRSRGITVRKTIDCLIATFAISNSHELLHCDADFNPFEAHLGLRVVHP